jgi:hypothetical protein
LYEKLFSGTYRPPDTPDIDYREQGGLLRLALGLYKAGG